MHPNFHPQIRRNHLKAIQKENKINYNNNNRKYYSKEVKFLNMILILKFILYYTNDQSKYLNTRSKLTEEVQLLIVKWLYILT